MANTSPNAALIKGAAVANKNYDNVPGMYAGIDKATKSISDSVMNVAKEKKAKKDAIDKGWNKAKDSVLESYGSFKTTVDYDFTFDELKGLKEELYAAQNENPPNQKVISSVNMRMNGIKSGIDDDVELRKTLATMDHSKAMSDNEKEILTAFQNENYTLSRSEGGEKEYNINGNKYTKAQIEDLHLPQVPKYSNDYTKVFTRNVGSKKFIKSIVQAQVSSIMPNKSDTKGLRAFAADDIMNQNFADMLDYDSTFKSEVNDYLNNDPRFDTNEDTPGIDETEFIMMKQAILDPNHEIWEGDVNNWAEVTHPLLAERLTNAIENEHSKAYPSETEEVLSENFEANWETETISTNANNYVNTETEPEATSTEEETEEKQPTTIAEQMLNVKRGIGIYNKFTLPKLRDALSSGDISNEVLAKYLVEIPGISIENGVVKGLKNVSSTNFNNAMALLQKEENINLGY
tara:strand:- start:167 stop:1552 length:1386 start_codon:yes stop_codon:yes gene_type:complete